jgi:hypothetical protein
MQSDADHQFGRDFPRERNARKARAEAKDSLALQFVAKRAPTTGRLAQ